jgi:hypothetical protein
MFLFFDLTLGESTICSQMAKFHYAKYFIATSLLTVAFWQMLTYRSENQNYFDILHRA